MAALPRDELAAKIRRVLPFLSELSENKRFPLPMSASMRLGCVFLEYMLLNKYIVFVQKMY